MSNSRMYWAVCGALLLVSVNCDREPPTAVEQSAPGATPPRVFNPNELPGLLIALADVQNRILPTFGNALVSGGLEVALNELGRGLGGDAIAFDSALGQARDAATQLEADSNLTPDIAAILLMLGRIEAARLPGDGGTTPTAGTSACSDHDTSCTTGLDPEGGDQ